MSSFHCYAILCSAISDWVNVCLFKITSVHLCSSSSSVLKWDNVLCSRRQVARMTLLSYPQNVSVAGIKQADHFSTITELPNDPSSFFFLKCVECCVNINCVHIMTWFTIVLLTVPQCNTQRKWRSCRKTHSCKKKKEEEWNNSEFWHNGTKIK